MGIKNTIQKEEKKVKKKKSYVTSSETRICRKNGFSLPIIWQQYLTWAGILLSTVMFYVSAPLGMPKGALIVSMTIHTTMISGIVILFLMVSMIDPAQGEVRNVFYINQFIYIKIDLFNNCLFISNHFIFFQKDFSNFSILLNFRDFFSSKNFRNFYRKTRK